MNFWEALEQSSWVYALGHSTWMYPATAVLHYFSFFWLVGTTTLIDLRLLRLIGRNENAAEWAEQLAPWTWTALVVAVVTGALMFSVGAAEFVINPMFQAKMVTTLGGLITVVLIQKGVPRWGQRPAVPASGKAVAVASLALWIGTILLAVKIPEY